MDVSIREMRAEDYEVVMDLWRSSEGIGLSGSDSFADISGYLERNAGLSFVAVYSREVVGTVLGGHDGRRGYLYHLAVREDFRNNGLGRKLLERCMQGLRSMGIRKCHLMAFEQNAGARAFWQKVGWEERRDLVVMSAQV